MKIDFTCSSPPPGPRIYCDRKSTSAKAAFQQQGLTVSDTPKSAEILWLRKGFLKYIDQLEPHQLINHFPYEAALINKGYLTKALNDYDAQHPGADTLAKDVYPESYCLFDPEERRRFFAQLPEKDSPDNLWIFKPGNNSRGRGIKIMWEMYKIRQQYGSLGNKYIENKDEQAIIQRYIKNPLLLNERKSEIRVYWLLASLNPLRVLLFNEGTVRLNTLPYQLDNFDNQLIHVTNVYQQYKHPDYDPNAILKWSFARLNDYLHTEKKLPEANFTRNVLMPKLRNSIAHVMRAGRDGFFKDYPNRGDCFGVYGADVILDENLKPYISEIQKGPGLSFSDEIKKYIIPPMLGEAARIMLEVRQARVDGSQPVDFQSRDRFDWVINELDPSLC